MTVYWHSFSKILYCLVFLFLLFGALAPASAQDGAKPLPPSLQQDAIQKLVSDLDPDQVEALGQLMTLLQDSAAESAGAEAADTPGLLVQIQTALNDFGAMVLGHFLSLPDLFSALFAGLGALLAGTVAGPVHILVGSIALILAAGFAAEFAFNRFVANKREAIRSNSPESLYETVKLVSIRAGLDLGGLVIFAVVALIAARLAVFDPVTRSYALQAVFWIVFLPRIIAALLRFALAPHRSELRLVSADNATARALYRSFTTVFAVVGVAFFLRNVMQGAGEDSGGTFRFFIGFAVNAWLIAIIWQARRGLTSIILGDEEDPTSGLERMARFWPYFSMGFIAFNWLLGQVAASMQIEALTAGRSLGVIALVIFAPFLDTMVRGIVSHIVPPMQGEGPVAEAAHLQTRHSYVRIARVALIAFLILAVGRIYGINLLALGGDDGSAVARNSVIFLLILAAGYLAWEITNLWVSRQLAKDSPPVETEDDDAEMGGAGKSRLATILPLLRMVLQVAIITLTVLLGLSQLGVNITPLLAGAGVIGLAIGFGAQTLVRDVVAGIFFLVDDAFRMGEFIDTGGVQGAIEKISIRSLQLRGTRGAVHIVPYGEIPQLTNLSRDWVIMKLRFTVPFGTDTEKVRKLFKRIGQDIMEMEEYKDDILAPFKGQGVNDVDDVGIVVRGKFTTKPGKQFGVRKEIYKRVQQAFEENGIEFARKEVRVHIPETTKLDEGQKEALAGAAAAAADPKPA
ncbi:mechanosensitive ion channel family protein [Roseibium denhamense]|uniref:Small-conductance mechanosensitive channel n=1 Tax=Roseibium denhamense TaxID=76305 RepID=A0ABY1P1E6_9HYPH|nr:mechanosensitive ion channel family protein [Roseibium denhamense]MTI04927.1 mechanosensitive ion channel family protein [Roseibium denhamense]SMP23330.1 Small-conductance mechanosensitive channel [Roseibium denhamense]